MKIELKNINVKLNHNDNGLIFDADLYVNDLKCAYIKNTGKNSVTICQPYAGRMSLYKKTEEYFFTLPDRKYSDFNITVKINLIDSINNMIQKYVNDKEHFKYSCKINEDMKNGICYGDDISYKIISWENISFKKILQHKTGKDLVKNKIKELAENGFKVLNTNIPTELYN